MDGKAMVLFCRWIVLTLMIWPVASAQSNPQPPAPDDPAIVREQTHLDGVSSRYSVEVPDDEHLPLSFRKREGPQGARLVNFSW